MVANFQNYVNVSHDDKVAFFCYLFSNVISLERLISEALKETLMHLLLKPTLDLEVLDNYHLVSNL